MPGLGYAEETTTLASTQIHYADVTITAGVEKLLSSPTPVNGVGEGEEGEVGSTESVAVEVRWEMGVFVVSVGVVIMIGVL